MAFQGQRVMLSRSLVPLDMFEKLHEILKRNGAEVCLCCNPSYNSRTDFHVLPSCESEKFADLQAQSCNVVGLECILRCAQQGKPLPSQKYTCCLGMEGVRVFATGFEPKEMGYIQQMVTGMCGELCTTISTDVDFVVAKDVLAPNYKCAAISLRKPIIRFEWLVQCFREHRCVSHACYKLPIFTGIRVCTTGIQMDERARIADVVVENGGSLQPDLTRDCTHLIVKSTDSDKFKMAQDSWCHIKCVNAEWVWNSLSEEVCLEESSYSVQAATTTHPVNIAGISGYPTPDKPSQDQDFQEMYLSGCRVYITGFEPVEMKRLVNMVLSGGGTRHMEFNERITHLVFGKPLEGELKDIRQHAMWGAMHIVTPSWLEECSRQRKEVAVSTRFAVPQAWLSQDFHLKPGGNKPAHFSEKPSTVENLGGRLPGKKQLGAQFDARPRLTESEDKTVPGRSLSTLAANPREGAALEKQMPSTLFSPVEQMIFREQRDIRLCAELSKDTDSQHPLVSVNGQDSPQDSRKRLPDVLINPGEVAGGPAQEPTVALIASTTRYKEMEYTPDNATGSTRLKLDIQMKPFERCVFDFAPSFQAGIRAEVVQWVLEGGGIMLGEDNKGELHEAEFLIVPHGQKIGLGGNFEKSVTTQWIKYCLHEGTLLDINSHILFQPLCCDVPMPGFESLRCAISQYADRERLLLYNLCHVLGAKIQKKVMSKRATHLLCMVGDGEKYEAALEWGIEIVTAEWLYACVAQNTAVLADPYRPKRLTAAEKEAGLAISTQCPAQSTVADKQAGLTTSIQYPAQSTAADKEAGLAISTQHPDQSTRNVEGSVTEKFMSQNEMQTSLPEFVEKGKTPNLKRNTRGQSSLGALELQTLHRKRASTNCFFASQAAGGSLDPWDQLTASWASEDVNERPLTRSKLKSHSSFEVSPNLSVSRKRKTIQVDRKLGQKTGEASQAAEVCQKVSVSGEIGHAVNSEFETEDEEAGADVASAIEGLLAQTSKVQSDNTSSCPDVDLLSPESMKPSRRNSEVLHDATNFKRPKLMSNRSTENGGEQLVPCKPSAESFEKFEESQMDSQVVAYDEDYSERQRIMERVRTRSMSTTRSGTRVTVQQREMSIDIKRLLKAADANK